MNSRERSDLTAVDANGNIVLIEIKRDRQDIAQRKEPFEFQAARYAASYATIKTKDDRRCTHLIWINMVYFQKGRADVQ
ncbi:hypothetical protein [Alkalicoccus saliphilus]|uniref:hypothetical protein n=1 Tax=Alkalicoccus saliphilus TaxID=200989 RepID=UPI001C3F9C33|nr:hypothetical protein [Alkalicoccus saliphilus]